MDEIVNEVNDLVNEKVNDFKAVLSDPGILKTSFDAISSIVDEVQIMADSDGIRLNALDRSHITFVHLELTRGTFDSYTCNTPQRINLDTEELMKVLKRGKSSDTVTLTVDAGNFIVTFEGDARRSFKIRLIDIEYETPQPPEIEYPVELEVPMDILKNSVQDVGIVADKAAFEVTDDKLIINGEGEFGDSNIEYLHGERVNEHVKSFFSLEKVKEMLKAEKFSENVKLKLGNDKPLIMTMEDGYEDVLSFILAPRIEMEED